MAVNDDERDDAARGGEAPKKPAGEAEKAASASKADKKAKKKPTEPEAPATAKAPAKAAPPSAAPKAASGRVAMPAWVVPAYVSGLALLFVGERVLDATPSAHWTASLLGLALVVVATVARFNPNWRAGGDRAQIENLLAALSVVGVVAIALYASTTEWGAEKIGIARMAADARTDVQNALTVAWAALVVVVVVPMLFAEAALLPMRRSERPESRRVRAAASAGGAIALAAVYGSLFVYAAGGVDLKADYSYFKTSEPSESTRRIAEALTEPITVTAFFPQVNEVRHEVERYLKTLAAAQPKLAVEVQDRLLVPKVAKDLRVTQDGVIVLARGDVQKRLTIGADVKSARPKLKTLDRDFQEQLLKIVRSRRTAYLTIGHGEINDKPKAGAGDPERDATIVRKLLEKQNYVVKNLGVSQGLGNELPDDADIVLALGPSEPFTAEEIASLGRYADRGGKLFLALDPDVPAVSEAAVSPLDAPAGSAPPAGSAALPVPPPSAPAAPGASAPAGSAAAPAPVVPLSGHAASLDQMARIAGLGFRPELLVNERQHLRRRYNDSDRSIIFSNRFSSHAAVSTLSQNSSRAVVVVSGSGSLDKASGSTEKVDFAVRSMTGTFADGNKNYSMDSPGEKLDQFNLAAAVSRPAKNPKSAPKKDEPKPGAEKQEGPAPPDEMRAFVVADSDAFTDVVLSNVVPNQIFFVDAVRWLGGEESFAGEVNTEEDVRIEHTKQKDLVWFYATIFGAPALVLGLGIWYSRRSRRQSGGAS